MAENIRLIYDKEEQFLKLLNRFNGSGRYDMIYETSTGKLYLVPAVTTKTLNVGIFKPDSESKREALMKQWKDVIMEVNTVIFPRERKVGS